jgi:hypothetical protein
MTAWRLLPWVLGHYKGNLGLGNTLGRPPQSRKKGPRLYRLRPHFAHFLAKQAQKWQKTALAGMAHPPKRGKRAQKKGAFGPFRPKKVAALLIWHEVMTSGHHGGQLDARGPLAAPRGVRWTQPRAKRRAQPLTLA